MSHQAVLDLEEQKPSHPFAHGSDIFLPIAGTVGMNDEQIVALFPGEELPIYVRYPKRHFPKEVIRLGDGKVHGKVLDMQAKFKPWRAGRLILKGLVKGKETHELHGTIEYFHGDLIDHTVFESFSLVTLTESYGVDDYENRRLIGIRHVMVTPYPRTVG